MIKLTEISKQKLPDLVKLSYEGDADLLEKYHIEKFNNIESAVKKEMELINNFDKKFELKYYAVISENESIGYVVRSGKYIISFCISILHRKKEILKEWWEKLVKEMEGSFNVGVMSNNTRALNFFKKMGLGILHEGELKNGRNEIYLSYK